MRLVDERELETEEAELSEYLPIIADILRKGRVEKPVVVREGNVVDKLFLLSLKSLGIKLIPISGREEKINMPVEQLGFYDEVKGDATRVFENPLELLYKNWPTPIVRLSYLSDEGMDVWAKLEFYNPFSNSIKDRVAWYMLERAKKKGLLKNSIYEASSSNTGIALAALAAVYRMRARIFIPRKVQRVTDTYLRVLGAEAVRVDKSLTVEAIDEVESLAERENATHLNQFYNDANFLVHLRFTAKEIDYQFRSMGRRPKAIVGGVGTSGHLSAISFYFKNRYPGTEIIAVQPAEGEIIPGIRRVETGMKWIDYIGIDRLVDVTQEEAVKSAIEFARNEGLLIGLSSGAVVSAFKKLGVKYRDVLLVFPDSGFKYFEFFEKYL